MNSICRYPGETDAELRERVVTMPIIIEARNAIWRAFGMRDKDAIYPTIYVNGKLVAYGASISFSQVNSPINLLGKFDVIEIIPNEQ